jgi:hypothetical protein
MMMSEQEQNRHTHQLIHDEDVQIIFPIGKMFHGFNIICVDQERSHFAVLDQASGILLVCFCGPLGSIGFGSDLAFALVFFSTFFHHDGRCWLDDGS